MRLFCSSCQQEKDCSEFSKKTQSKRGYSYKCKKCHNAYSRNVWYKKNSRKQIQSSVSWKKRNKLKALATKYKTTVEEVERVFSRSDGKCEMCGSMQNLCLDHCHKTKDVRGVLCSRCNVTLGRMGDNLQDMQKKYQQMLSYLSLTG